MEIKNSKVRELVFKNLKKINERMPKLDLTESISIKDCLGRKLAEDVYANIDYPPVALSAKGGEMFNLKEDITDVEQFKKIKSNNFYALLLSSENPYRTLPTQHYYSNVMAHTRIGNIANTVVPVKQYLAWLAIAANEELPDGEILEPIRIGTGILPVGIDYKKQELLLNKDQILTLPQKMLLKQANVEQVNVYKSLRIAVLCVDYALEDFNSQIEFEYIQECIKSWGYEFEAIRIKPFRDYSNLTKSLPVEDLNLTTDRKEYFENLKRVSDQYDYIVACGLGKSISSIDLGLMRGGFRTSITTNMIPGLNSIMYCGEYRSPVKRVMKKFYNDQGNVFAEVQQTYEDYAVITYLADRIQDIIINMHLIVRPSLLNRLYAKPHQPNWKVGVLTHDYELSLGGDHLKYLWAYASDIHYGKFDKIEVTSMPQLKIINEENPRPDKLKFMKDCNCFIIIMANDKYLKAGEYLYYLEI